LKYGERNLSKKKGSKEGKVSSWNGKSEGIRTRLQRELWQGGERKQVSERVKGGWSKGYMKAFEMKNIRGRGPFPGGKEVRKKKDF